MTLGKVIINHLCSNQIALTPCSHEFNFPVFFFFFASFVGIERFIISKFQQVGCSPEGTNDDRGSIWKPGQNKPGNQKCVINVQEIQDTISHHKPCH